MLHNDTAAVTVRTLVGIRDTFRQDCGRCSSWCHSEGEPTLPLFCDPTEEAYRAYGLLEGGPSEVLFDAPDEYLTCQPDIGRGMADERRALARPVVDNPWLLPGEFVVAPDGRLATTYRFQFCEHWIDPRVNLAAIRFAFRGAASGLRLIDSPAVGDRGLSSSRPAWRPKMEPFRPAASHDC